MCLLVPSQFPTKMIKDKRKRCRKQRDHGRAFRTKTNVDDKITLTAKHQRALTQPSKSTNYLIIQGLAMAQAQRSRLTPASLLVPVTGRGTRGKGS